MYLTISKALPLSLRARLMPVAVWALCGGCNLDLGGVPVAPGKDAGPSRMDAATARDSGPEMVRDSGLLVQDASDGAALPANDADTDAGQDVPVRHPTCSIVADSPRDPDDIAVDATGRPFFDLYRDVSCDVASSYPTCETDAQCGPTASCIHSENQRGICEEPNHEGEFVLTLDAGRCQAMAPLKAHAKACCDMLPGFDCRAWPYPSSSKPGELCARARDCEPGLICERYFTEGFGLCICPDGKAANDRRCL